MPEELIPKIESNKLNAQVLGAGFSGLTYGISVPEGDYALVVQVPLEGRNNHEIDLATKIANYLGLGINELKDIGLVLPLSIMDGTCDDELQLVISKKYGINIELVQEFIAKMHAKFNIHPILSANKFANQMVQSQRFMSMMDGVMNLDDRDKFRVLKEVSKFRLEHNYVLYPLLKGKVASLGEDVVNLQPISNESLSVLVWLASKLDIVNAVGYVHGDPTLNNVLSSEGRLYLADFKDCEPMTREQQIRERKVFAWNVVVMLCGRKLTDKLEQVIRQKQPYPEDVIAKMLGEWKRQFIHGINIPTVMPKGSGVFDNYQIALQVFKELNIDTEILRSLENFAFQTISYSGFITSVIARVQSRNIPNGNAAEKKKRKRR